MSEKRLKTIKDRIYEYSDLQKLVRAMCDQNAKIIFSIFQDASDSEEEFNTDNWQVKAPDIDSTNPVFKGKVEFFIDYWRVADRPVYSPVYENPTWRDIINACNNLLQQGDPDGVYLEGMNTFKQTKSPDSVTKIEFCIGS